MKHFKSLLSSALICGLVFSAPLTAEKSDSKKSMTEKIESSDTWLQAKLVTTYALNKHLSLWDFDVDVRDRVAYLQGEVDTSVDKSLAEEVAESIEGIERVENQIVVKEGAQKANMNKTADKSFGQEIEDLTTTASIKSKLLLNKDTDGLEVEVETNNGIVSLSGTADSDEEKALIEQIAKNTHGVTSVENKVAVTKG